MEVGLNAVDVDGPSHCVITAWGVRHEAQLLHTSVHGTYKVSGRE